MNTFKRIGLVVVSCIILLLALVCPVSATDEPMITRQDFIDLGYIEGEDGVLYVPKGGYDPLSFMSILLSSEKNYSDFNPNSIPWRDTPQYVQDIINNGFENVFSLADSSLISNYKMPFILVKVDGARDRIVVFAGYNLFLGLNTYTMSLRICGSSYFSSYSSCYYAIYRLSDFTITSPWSVYEPTPWGDTGLVNYYSSSLALTDDHFDFYLYGGNTIRPDVVSVSLQVSSTNQNAVVVGFANETIGFQDGRYFQFSSEWSGLYCSYFTPSYYSSVDSDIVGDYDSAEDELMNSYDPGNLSGDLVIDIDSNSWNVIFQIFNMFVANNSVIMILIITILSLGVIALILNR